MDVVLTSVGMWCADAAAFSQARERELQKSKMLLFVVERALQKVRVQEVSMINVASLTQEWAEMSGVHTGHDLLWWGVTQIGSTACL